MTMELFVDYHLFRNLRTANTPRCWCATAKVIPLYSSKIIDRLLKCRENVCQCRYYNSSYKWSFTKQCTRKTWWWHMSFCLSWPKASVTSSLTLKFNILEWKININHQQHNLILSSHHLLFFSSFSVHSSQWQAMVLARS